MGAAVGDLEAGSSQSGRQTYKQAILAGQYFSRRFTIPVAVVTCLTFVLLLRLGAVRSINNGWEAPQQSSRPNSREAYVTFTSDVETEPWYGIQTKLLIFQFKHDPLTADYDRDFVILATERLPQRYIDEVTEMGAKVIIKPFITSMPGYEGGNPAWRDQFTKLHVLNLTQYERVLYLDNDYTITRSYARIWDDPAADLPSGLASNPFNDMIHTHPPSSVFDGFNAGFWMCRPSTELFEDVLKTKHYDTYSKEQSALNMYFHPSGAHPWGHLDRQWSAQWGQTDDIEAGVAGLHEKVWQHPWRHEIDRGFTEFWRQKLGRMEGYWLAKKGISVIAIPNIQVKVVEEVEVEVEEGTEAAIEFD